MMAASEVGDIKESALALPLLSPDEPLVAVVVLGQVCPCYLNNTINPVIVP